MKAIVICDSNNGIARGGDQPLHIPRDLKRLRTLTANQTVVMGRKTAEVIGKPLTRRTTIVITSHPESLNPLMEGVQTMTLQSFVENMKLYRSQTWLLGGAQLYQALLPYCSHVYMTRVETDLKCDQFFPRLPWYAWRLVDRGATRAYVDANGNEYPYHFDIYRRVQVVFNESRTGTWKTTIAMS